MYNAIILLFLLNFTTYLDTEEAEKTKKIITVSCIQIFSGVLCSYSVTVNLNLLQNAYLSILLCCR